MKSKYVNIDFKKMAKAVRENVRNKAVLSGNTIVYLRDGKIIEENPRTLQKRILKREFSV